MLLMMRLPLRLLIQLGFVPLAFWLPVLLSVVHLQSLCA
jgi:hypothetical protein